MSPAETPLSSRTFDSDETVRWSCRAGEFVLWVGTGSFLASDQASAWTIRDFWQMRDGDLVTITNRLADLPGWFELYPTEAAGRASFEMMKRLNAGYRPIAPMDGQNIWRVKAGDRLVWVMTSNPRKPVREILSFRVCGLVVGENSTPSSNTSILFGAPQGSELPPADAVAMRAGVDAAATLGMPREFAPEWMFGD